LGELIRSENLLRISTVSDKETEEAGFYLGKVLVKGDIICLTGDLGAGKTVLVKGIASGLGVDDYVTSPTFTLINEYEGEIPVYHFDVYRIADTEELYDIGINEYLYGDGIILIEWADLIREILPEEVIWVNIDKCFSNTPQNQSGQNYSMYNNRIIYMEFRGEKYKKAEEKYIGIMKIKGKEVVMG